MRCVLPSFALGATLLAFVACVGDDPSDTNDGPDGSTPDGTTPTVDGSPQPDGGPGADGGGDGGGPGDGVEGNVIDLGAVPVANATVRIGSVTVQTDSAGQFKIPNVTPPYDVDVVSPLDPTADGTTKFVMSIRGVTTRTPIVHVRFTGAERRVSVSGTTTGLTFSGNNNRLKVAFIPQVGVPVSATTPGTHAVNPDTFTEQTTWEGKPAVAGVWYVLHWNEPTGTPGRPAAWSGFKRIQANLSDNVATTLNAGSLATLSSTTLSGTIAFPANTTGKTVTFGLKVDPADRGGYTFGTLPMTPASNAFSMSMPDAVGQASGMKGMALGTARAPNAGGVANQTQLYVWKSNLATSATNVTLAFPEAPALATPAEAATAKVTDTIKWSGGTAPYRVDIECKGYKASVITMVTEAVLPAGLGTWPTTPTPCTASVSSYGHVTTIDAHVAVDAPYKTTSHFAGDGSLTVITNSFTSAQ